MSVYRTIVLWCVYHFLFILVVEGSSTLDALKGLSKPVCAATPTPGVEKVCNPL